MRYSRGSASYLHRLHPCTCVKLGFRHVTAILTPGSRVWSSSRWSNSAWSRHHVHSMHYCREQSTAGGSQAHFDARPSIAFPVYKAASSFLTTATVCDCCVFWFGHALLANVRSLSPRCIRSVRYAPFRNCASFSLSIFSKRLLFDSQDQSARLRGVLDISGSSGLLESYHVTQVDTST